MHDEKAYQNVPLEYKMPDGVNYRLSVVKDKKNDEPSTYTMNMALLHVNTLGTIPKFYLILLDVKKKN